MLPRLAPVSLTLTRERNGPQHADINVNKILVANKCDVESRKVSTEEVRRVTPAPHPAAAPRERRVASAACARLAGGEARG